MSHIIIQHHILRYERLEQTSALEKNQELWTLLNFIEPFKFPTLEEFEMNFGDIYASSC